MHAKKEMRQQRSSEGRRGRGGGQWPWQLSAVLQHRHSRLTDARSGEHKCTARMACWNRAALALEASHDYFLCSPASAPAL
jgi:hypothetical protein